MSVTAPPPGASPDPVGALARAGHRYGGAGLRLPPVPPALAAELIEQDEWQFGTQEVDLTDRAGFLADARAPQALAQVGFGHVGHGVNSWFLCYRLIEGPLAVFVRLGFGGVYDPDPALSLRGANAVTAAVGRLLDAAAAGGRFAPAQRLVVVLDEVAGSGWEVAGPQGRAWENSDDPLAAAAAFLAGAAR